MSGVLVGQLQRDFVRIFGFRAKLQGLAIVIVVWGVNMLGQGLREYLDPKSRGY